MAGADGLSRIQRRALVALMTSRTVAEAAEATGVSTRTLERWLSDPGFAAAYRSTARDASRQAMSALLSAQLEAVAALRDALQAESPATQVRAARALLEIGVRAREVDVDERIDNLEGEVRRWQTGDVAPVWSAWSVTPAEASTPLTGPAAPVGRELAFLDAIDDPADAERRSLLARRLDELLPYPLRPEHPDAG